MRRPVVLLIAVVGIAVAIPDTCLASKTHYVRCTFDGTNVAYIAGIGYTNAETIAALVRTAKGDNIELFLKNDLPLSKLLPFLDYLRVAGIRTEIIGIGRMPIDLKNTDDLRKWLNMVEEKRRATSNKKNQLTK